jgi:hypothetical protein
VIKDIVKASPSEIGARRGAGVVDIAGSRLVGTGATGLVRGRVAWVTRVVRLPKSREMSGARGASLPPSLVVGATADSRGPHSRILEVYLDFTLASTSVAPDPPPPRADGLLARASGRAVSRIAPISLCHLIRGYIVCTDK